MRVELTCCTQVLLQEVQDEKFDQASVAMTYAMAIRSSHETNWKAVNEAIISRWSRSGLERIKRMAWRIIEKDKK